MWYYASRGLATVERRTVRWATSQELPPHRYRPAHGHRVARRLLQVLALMAEGRTNTAIGQALVVTQGAVEKHISSIFSKLGLPPSDNDHRRVVAVLTRLGAGA